MMVPVNGEGEHHFHVRIGFRSFLFFFIHFFPQQIFDFQVNRMGKWKSAANNGLETIFTATEWAYNKAILMLIWF